MRNVILVLLSFLLPLTLLYGQSVRYVDAPRLNLRDAPGKTGAIVQVLQQGDTVEVLQEYDNGWSHIRVKGAVGYTAGSHLQVLGDPLKAAKTAHSTAVQEKTVYICLGKSSYAYHQSSSCRGLNRCSHGVSSLAESDARGSYGRTPCRICY